MHTFVFAGRFGRLATSSRWFRCVLLFFAMTLICTACSSSSSVLSPTSEVSGRAPQPLPGSAWEQISFPTPLADVQGVAVSPSDPAVLIACTAHLQTQKPNSGAVAQPMTVWRTTDAGIHWRRYESILGAGTQCFVSFAPDDPQRVALQTSQTADNAQPCAHDSFYLSNDGGAQWQRMPQHTTIAPNNVSGWCDIQVTRRHLYLHYSFTFAPQAAQVSLLERSDDNGVNWSRIDRGLGDNVLFSMPEIGSGDTLAITVTHVPTQMPTSAVATSLWLSTNGGNTWQHMSTLQDAGTHLLSSQFPPGRTENTWPTPDHPFYALEHEQIPSNLYRERVQASVDGRLWSLLPALPVSGTSADRPGILQVLGVLADGSLVIWGPESQKGVPPTSTTPDQFSAFWLWIWNPTMRQWQAIPSPLKTPASETCGLCWQALTATSGDGAAYVYVARFRTGTTGTTLPGMFRIRLPSRA